MILTFFLTELATPVYLFLLKTIYFAIAEHNLILQLKDKHIFLRLKKEGVLKSETKILLLKTSRSRLIFSLD